MQLRGFRHRRHGPWPCNFWIRDPENGLGNVKSEVNLAVLEVLKREGVEIPFPQRVVHAILSREGREPPDGRIFASGPPATS